MPRAPKSQVVVTPGPNGLVAAAVRMTGRSGKPRKPKNAPQWYSQAWEFFDLVGEYRYAVTWVGNLLSRATLEVWEDGQLTKNETAIAALNALFGGAEGQREMLRQVGTHLTVPGDCYLVGEDMGEAPDKWSIVSASRISVIGQTDTNDGTWKVGNKELDDPLVIRIWRPHPNDQEKADSPSRAVLPILSEIVGMSKMVAAQFSSRLTGAGIFAVPSEMTFASVRGVTTNGDDQDQQTIVNAGVEAFLTEIMETMMEAMSDPDSPAARTPILMQGPGEHLDKLKHLTFWTPLDEQAKVLRDEAIRRLALGMDMPPEILTGSGELNHWNAWQVEEASIKAHTEPLLQLITTAITEKYLRPYLVDKDMDEEDARRFVIHADTTKIRLRPNRSKEALELHDRALLSGESAVRENGFDEADMMAEDERTEFFKRKVASGSTTPELVAWALNALGIPIPVEMIQVQETPTEAPGSPSLLEHPERVIPDPTEADVAASAVVVYRALERAGAKLRTKYPEKLVPGSEKIANNLLYRYARIEPDMIDDLLAGAWDCAGDLKLKLAPSIMDGYVRQLLTTSDRHEPERFQAFAMGRR